MKGEEFQALVGQLGALSEGQRVALLKALSGAKKPEQERQPREKLAFLVLGAAPWMAAEPNTACLVRFFQSSG